MTLKGCVSAHKSTHARTHTDALDYNRPPTPLGFAEEGSKPEHTIRGYALFNKAKTS